MAKKLTNSREVPFELCFKYPLENGFTFKELTKENIREFQVFLDKVSKMTVQRKRQIADAMQGHFQNGNLPKHWREEGYQRQMV